MKNCSCGSKYVINKKYNLCGNCNYKRLHQGKSQREIEFIKKVAKQEVKRLEGIPVKLVKRVVRRFKKKSNKPVVKLTKHQKEVNIKYSIVITKIDLEREWVCTGCERHQGGNIKLSHSHLISRKDCKSIGREDLISDPKNITYHCLDFAENVGCHRKWESKNINIMKELKDFEVNLQFIKTVSIDLYNRIVNA